jgi:hypothetical protein
MNENNEHIYIALMWVGMGLGTVFLMMLWDAWCQMQRDRRRKSYQRHPSQRKDLYQQRNRGTVQK